MFAGLNLNYSENLESYKPTYYFLEVDFFMFCQCLLSRCKNVC